MSTTNTPKDGDFAAELDRMAQAATKPSIPAPSLDEVLGAPDALDKALADLQELEDAPALSDEELARQALAHPGGDGDASTPE
jgi:hypothetical protein